MKRKGAEAVASPSKRRVTRASAASWMPSGEAAAEHCSGDASLAVAEPAPVAAVVGVAVPPSGGGVVANVAAATRIGREGGAAAFGDVRDAPVCSGSSVSDSAAGDLPAPAARGPCPLSLVASMEIEEVGVHGPAEDAGTVVLACPWESGPLPAGLFMGDEARVHVRGVSLTATDAVIVATESGGVGAEVDEVASSAGACAALLSAAAWYQSGTSAVPTAGAELEVPGGATGVQPGVDADLAAPGVAEDDAVDVRRGHLVVSGGREVHVMLAGSCRRGGGAAYGTGWLAGDVENVAAHRVVAPAPAHRWSEAGGDSHTGQRAGAIVSESGGMERVGGGGAALVAAMDAAEAAAAQMVAESMAAAAAADAVQVAPTNVITQGIGVSGLLSVEAKMEVVELSDDELAEIDALEGAAVEAEKEAEMATMLSNGVSAESEEYGGDGGVHSTMEADMGFNLGEVQSGASLMESVEGVVHPVAQVAVVDDQRENVPPDDVQARREAIAKGKRPAEPSDSEDSSDDEWVDYRDLADMNRHPLSEIGGHRPVPEIVLGGMRPRGLDADSHFPGTVDCGKEAREVYSNTNGQGRCQTGMRVEVLRGAAQGYDVNVEDNVGEERTAGDASGQEGRSFLRSFTSDFLDRVALPRDFSEMWKNEIGSVVLMRGGSNEPFQVHVDEDNGRLVFGLGWSEFAASERLSEQDIGLFELRDYGAFNFRLYHRNGSERLFRDRPGAAPAPAGGAASNGKTVTARGLPVQGIDNGVESAVDFELGPRIPVSEELLGFLTSIWRNYYTSFPLYVGRITRSHLNNGHFYFGKRFSRYLPNVRTEVLLIYGDASFARAGVMTKNRDGLARLTAGWRPFSRNYNVAVGEVYVFRIREEDGRLRIRMFKIQQ
ncbi:hypothetical protein ACP70R_050091 [Stipagrostis hirtigluma subsp. patula]